MRVIVSSAMAAAQRRKADIGQTLPHRRVNRAKNTSESGSDLLGEEHDELKRNFRAIQEENLKLQAVITDVTEVNKRWQRYNNDRQMYVDKLLTTIKEQQEQMNKISEDTAANLTKQNTTGDEMHNLKRENLELKEKLQVLTKKLDEKEREGVALRVQAQVHRDDWEAEKAEKISAQQQREQAEKRVEELALDVRTLAQKLRDERLNTPIQCPKCGFCLPLEHTTAPKPAETCKRKGSLIARGAHMTSNDDMYLTCDVAGSTPSTFEMAKDAGSALTDTEEKCPEAAPSAVKGHSGDNSPCTSFSVVSGEGAVTLGFSSSGLASVTSFPVRMYSIPVSTALQKPTSSPSDSPSTARKDSQRSSQSHTPARMSSEEDNDGVATQTRTDIICPGCNAFFPPGRHIDFLDHFELCQQQTPSNNDREDRKMSMTCPKCTLTFPAHHQVTFLDHFDQCQWPEKRSPQPSAAKNGCMNR